MGKISETSFANRHGRGMELYTYIKELRNYNPSKPEIKPDEYLNTLNRIMTFNTSIAEKKNALKIKITERDQLIRGPKGIIALACKIRDTSGTLLPEGKKAKLFKEIQSECQKMTNSASKKKTLTEPPAGTTPPSNEVKAHRSTTETGVNALIQYAKNIGEIMKSIPNYNSSNPDLTVAGFLAKVQTAEQAIQSVHAAYDQYDHAVTERLNSYDSEAGLKELMTRIKDYIAYEYGKNSEEYRNAMRIKY